MELLAPAGSEEALIAAVQSGADAVYIGGSRFSARSSAKNFDSRKMKEMIDYCHIRGVSVHVAANTLLKENEISSYIDYIGELNEMGVDAVIIQDLGMAKAVYNRYPDLPIHASTQMTCASLNTARALESAGFSRIVLARELDYEAIEKIAKGINAEVEVFVHGAICMSYSGQCLMSSMIGGRSGNRGMCAQPCRLPYKFLQNGKDVNKGYLLSPKDMCLVNHLEKLESIGVNSLKIEGRLKRPEYVSSVVGIYRKCIDEKRKATADEYNELLEAFNRSGFTDGYFVNKTGRKMMSYDNPSNIAENKFTDEAKSRCKNDCENKKIPVTIKADLLKFKPLILTVSDINGNSVTMTGDAFSEIAQNRPLDKERIIKQLSKLGQTPFVADNVNVNLDDGIILPISEINNLRRKAVEELIKKRSLVSKRRVIDSFSEFENVVDVKPILSAKVKTTAQAKVCIKKGIKRIYAPSEVVVTLKESKEDIEIIQIMPPIDKEGKNKINVFGNALLINSLGQFRKDDKKYFADYRLNSFNSYTIDALKHFSCVTLSPELSINEIRGIKKPIDTELIVYGRISLMTFENCPVKAHLKCDKGKSFNEFVDRMNEKFVLMCGEGCFPELLNSKPIYMADKFSDLLELGIKSFRLDFTVENEKECETIVDEYQKAMKGLNVKSVKENTFTRGHFYKKVD